MSSSNIFSLSSTVKLNNNNLIPLIHLGVYMTSGRTTSTAVSAALSSGYRAIDSAEWYENEHEVGAAMLAFLQSTSAKQQGLKREDLWFTTKLRTNNGYEATRREVKKSIKASGMGYLDLYLLHSPYGGRSRRLECWRAVEDAISDGEVRAGGVSNYGVKHLQELLDSNPRILPAVNQIEVHPFNTNAAITSFCASHAIVVQAYAPLAKAYRMQHPLIVSLARKYKCTPAQLLIRWSLQHGYVPLPKSVSQERIVENGSLEVWADGTGIGREDMEAMDGLDEGLITDWDPTDAD